MTDQQQVALTATQIEASAVPIISDRIEAAGELIQRTGCSPEQYRAICARAFLANPRLGQCTRDSVAVALATAIELGLVPDGRSAAIVPRNNHGIVEATIQPMIAGELQLARQALPGLNVRARTVYRGDHFEYTEDETGTHINHVRNPEASTGPQDVIAAYAVANWPGASAPEIEVLYRAELEKRRAASPAGNSPSGPWNRHYGEMAERSVLRLVLKRLPRQSAPGLVYEGERLPAEIITAPDGQQYEVRGGTMRRIQPSPHQAAQALAERRLAEEKQVLLEGPIKPANPSSPHDQMMALQAQAQEKKE